MKLSSILKILLVILLFAGMGCKDSTIDEPSFTLGSEFPFKINNPYTSADGHYTLKITEINDSRCPVDVFCIWQGEIVLKGDWTENGKKSTFEIHSVLSQESVQPAGYTIQVGDANPLPRSDMQWKPEDYTIILLIQKN